MPTSSDGADWADEITTVYRHDSTHPHLRAVPAEGKDLDAIFDHARKTGERLSPEFVYNLYAQACAELVRIGRARSVADGALIHGQLTPENMFVASDGQLCIVEPSPTSSDRPKPGSGLGRRSYEAPEQLRRVAVDVRADIFSLALCMAELFILKRLSDASRVASGQTEAELVAALRGAPRAVQELGRVLVKSITREVDQRYRGLSPLLADLRHVGKKVGFHVGANITAASVRLLFSKPVPPAALPAEPPSPQTEEPAASLDVFASLAKTDGTGWSQLLPPPPAVPAVAIPRSLSAPPPAPPPRPQLASSPTGAFFPQTSPSSPPPSGQIQAGAPISGPHLAMSPSSPPPSLRPEPFTILPPETELPLGLGGTIPPPRGWARSRTLIESGLSRYKALPASWKLAGAVGVVLLAAIPLLRPSKGTLFIAVSGHLGQRLSNVATTVDGTKECVGDRCAFELNPGMHEVSVRADGYVPQSQVTVVRAKDETAANFRLERASSYLSVKGQPEGTMLFVDGERIGKLPQQLELPPGSHKLRFEAPSYVAEERSVDLGIAETKNLGEIVLRPAVGTARFELRTPGVDVSLVSDTERRDHVDVSRPIELDLSKRWILEAHKPGFPTLRETLDWGTRTEQTFIVALDKPQGNTATPVRSEPARVSSVRERPVAPVESPRSEPAPTPANSPAARAERSPGNPEVCIVSFNSIPASNVFLDGTRLGMTPQARVTVRPGAHVAQFSQGELRKSKPFSCEGGESKIVALHLSP